MMFLYIFSVVMHKDKEENGILSHIHSHHDGYRTRDLGAIEHHMLDGDMFLQVSYVFIPCIQIFERN